MAAKRHENHCAAHSQPNRSAACPKPQRRRRRERVGVFRGEVELPTRCGVGHSAVLRKRSAPCSRPQRLRWPADRGGNPCSSEFISALRTETVRAPNHFSWTVGSTRSGAAFVSSAKITLMAWKRSVRHCSSLSSQVLTNSATVRRQCSRTNAICFGSAA